MSMKVTKEQFIGMTYEELLAENAKLRELLQYVADNHLCGTWLIDHMRELGLEVE